jgi:hypothetical protein
LSFISRRILFWGQFDGKVKHQNGSCEPENGASTRNHPGFLIFAAHPDGARGARQKFQNPACFRGPTPFSLSLATVFR